jgi:hypothetical protein
MALTLDAAVALAAKLYKVLDGRRAEIQRREDYFAGRHPLQYASEQWREFHGQRFKGFSDNWCGVVASSPAERQGLIGFRIGEDDDVLSSDERDLFRDWQLNDMDSRQRGGLLTSAWAGRSFVSVWGTPSGEPRVRWEDPREVVVAYDPETGEATASLKAWHDRDEHIEYATLCLPDQVWPLQRSRGSGAIEVPSRVAAEFGSSAQWKLRDGAAGPGLNPLGMVLHVEWRNRPDLHGEPVSEISGAMCMQDSINLMWSYLFGAADWASLPARVVMGQEPPKIPKLDASGNVIGFEAVPAEKLTNGRLLWLTGQNTKIGQWDSAKLDVFLEVVNIGARHLSAQTRTPIFMIVGELSNINGDTVKAAETPFIQKIGDINAGNVRPAREVFRRIALVRQRAAVAEACRLGRVQWKDAETITAAQRSDAALKDRQVGISLATVLERHYGMSQDEIAREMDRNQAEQSDPMLTKVVGQIDAASGTRMPPAGAPAEMVAGAGA